jgi:ATP-dependent Clp protease ATP-binding subunit ClpA
MFERFAGPAREAVATALNEARHSGTNQIDCDHLLIALASADTDGAADNRTPDNRAADNIAAETLTAAGLSPNRLRSLAAIGPHAATGTVDTGTLDADALAAIGIDLDAVRRAAENAFGPGSLDRRSPDRRRPGRTRMTADAKRALELAIRAAHRGHDREITSGHLLLGILDQGHNRALTLLTSAEVQPADLRADLARRMAA